MEGNYEKRRRGQVKGMNKPDGKNTKKISLNSLESVKLLKSGRPGILKKEKWLMYLALTKESNINLERLNSMEELNSNYILNYAERTLQYLEGYLGDHPEEFDERLVHILEETLKWAETAKGGMVHHRKEWLGKGYNLFAHNLGSSRIYMEYAEEEEAEDREIIRTLIATHGLVGQYIRGEVSVEENKPLYNLISGNVDRKYLTKAELASLLLALNYCIIFDVIEDIWYDIGKQAEDVIGLISEGRFDGQYDRKERIRRLRTISIRNGENFDPEFEKHFSSGEITDRISAMLEKTDLWYVEAALYDFSFEEFIKILLLTSREREINDGDKERIADGPDTKIRHISFERFMKELYYQHDGRKRINIYKKRIIEKYLAEMTPEDILIGRFSDNPHAGHFAEIVGETLFFRFRFSPAGGKLIEFCVEAEKSDVLYENAVLLLFDLFGLRKDKYDRFYEEERYLKTMNQSIDYKKVILDYITGKSILDIGPGGGALMDLIEERFPDKTVRGIDIAQNVLDALKKKKQLEHRKWNVLYGDALNLGQYIEKGSTDTVIYSSILHELFSYIEYNGRKFNHETLAAALKSAFDILPTGGRIIIRDGIMTEPVDQKRIIRFFSEDGMDFLQRYARDFKGRRIEYSRIGQNEVRMPVNDAMEFLYTYTWGEKSYVHEVNEQFGYFTPGGYRKFIGDVLGNAAEIIEFRHYLQEGYTVALAPKIGIFDEEGNPVRLPDSTCIIVIEKETSL